MKATRKLAAVAGATLLATAAFAAPSVEITNVQQQYPWTNTVDITFSVQGVKDFPAKTAAGAYASNETYFVTFEATDADGNPVPDTSGATILTNALAAGSGTGQVAQWRPALGLQLTDCTLKPSVFRGEDDAYLVINLETNALGKYDYWYEPMSAPEHSNARYNTPEYKTTKLVLRHIHPGEYSIGHASQTPDNEKFYTPNSPHTVTVPDDGDYYIGVFMLTVAQYNLIMNGTTSDNLKPYQCRWADLRGSVAPDSPLIPDANHELVLGRLAGRTGLHIDLPTEEMWEIAARARSTTAYYWGDAIDNAYLWHSGNSGKQIQPVGGRRPNAWGLYDMLGNNFEWMRSSQGDRTDLCLKTTDIYTCSANQAAANVAHRVRGGSAGYTDRLVQCSHRNGSFSNIYTPRIAVYPAAHYPQTDEE